MTVYECDLSILRQRQAELVAAAARNRIAASAATTSLRAALAWALHATADVIDPRPAVVRRRLSL